jgi:Xaa-Pro aminopeptidase
MNPTHALDTPREVLERRRRAALAALGRGAMVLPSSPVQYRSRDDEWPPHADRELFYLTGVAEAGAVALLTGGDEPRLILFVQERDAEAELWTGARIGTEGAAERFRPDECHPLNALGETLPRLLKQADRIFCRLGRCEDIDSYVLEALGHARGRGARTGSGPRAVVDPGEILDDLRIIKDEHEITLLRRAAQITVEGHRVAAARVAPGSGEWEVEAAVDAAFRAAGGSGPGFETIVGSGANGCVLHYRDNSAVIAADALVLVDAGADYGLYSGDVTRTFPAGGRFTPEQRSIYEVVDAARRSAIERIAPGVPVSAVHHAATEVLVDGLIDLGVLSGDAAQLIESEAHKPFYPHQTSHWLGLDVHDPGDYARDGSPRALEAGMVLTVEPGLYFRAGPAGAADRLVGIGVRIEDDVLVTSAGHEVLTAGVPTAAKDIEALVQEAG